MGENVPIYATIRSVYRDTFSQEVRFAASPIEKLSYVAGAYYQDNKLDYENNTGLGSGHPFSGILWPAGRSSLQNGDGGQKTSAYAIFAEGNYNIAEATRITVGARWSDEKKDFNLRPIGATARVNKSKSWSDVTYRLGFDHRFSKAVLAYATYSTGFKSGGFNEQATSSATAALSFDEEQADSVEVGLKSDLAGGTVRLNLAAFHVKYKDLQLDSVIPVPGSTIGQESVITNAGKSTSYGVEAELAWLATDAVSIQGTLGYLHAKYDEFGCDLDRNPANGNEDCTVLEVKRHPASFREPRRYVSGPPQRSRQSRVQCQRHLYRRFFQRHLQLGRQPRGGDNLAQREHQLHDDRRPFSGGTLRAKPYR